jgi:4-hydroxybenzoate polyprenyltransferase
VIVSSIVFVLASFQLNRTCGLLSPVALAIVFWYSLAKRYTSYTQAFLGLAMAVAPVGGWLAAGGPIGSPCRGCSAWRSACWVEASTSLCLPGRRLRSRARTQFDPGAIRVARSLWISRAMHVATVSAWRRWRGCCRSAPSTWRRRDGRRRFDLRTVAGDRQRLSQVKRAFDLNGWVGILYFVTTELPCMSGKRPGPDSRREDRAACSDAIAGATICSIPFSRRARSILGAGARLPRSS